MVLRHAVLGALLAAVSTGAQADGAAGKWNGNIETPNGPFAFVFEFTVDGANLTGNMSNDFMGAVPISEGTIDGDDLAFKISFEGGPGGAMTVNYKGTVKGDAMTLTSSFEGAPPGGGPAVQTFTVTRAQ
jgi:hypothetical protein